MSELRAATAAAANAQQFVLPVRLEEWRAFARLLDGYKIAKELSFDLRDWGYAQEQRFEQSQQWDLSVLELRLMLFYQFRADYMTGYTYHERDALVDSLLRALSRQTGQPYGQEDAQS